MINSNHPVTIQEYARRTRPLIHMLANLEYELGCPFCDGSILEPSEMWHEEECPVNLAQNLLIEEGRLTASDFTQRGIRK